MLEIKNITIKYGKSIAVENVSITVGDGAIVGLVGANGAGKSTVLNALMCMVPLTDGEIWFNGERIDGISTQNIVRKGIVLVPEGRQLFPYMTVAENLMLGATLRTEKAAINKDMEYVLELFPRLGERLSQKAGTLSGGEQQMLAIGRGIMANPKLLCLDEPSVGLAPVVIEQLKVAIPAINSRGVSIFLVEQNTNLVFGVSQTGYVLQVGRMVLSGTNEELKKSDMVRKAYLGG